MAAMNSVFIFVVPSASPTPATTKKWVEPTLCVRIRRNYGTIPRNVGVAQIPGLVRIAGFDKYCSE